jgi:hypothetical protein
MSTMTAHDVAADVATYPAFLAAVRAHFARATGGGGHLFTTTATGLFEAFLAALPAPHRQQFTCAACRRFVDAVGGIVTVDAAGSATSPLWDPDGVPAFFRAPVAAIAARVASAAVDGVYLSSAATWGQPVTASAKPPGAWHHLAVASTRVFRAPLLTAGQAMAGAREEYAMLCRGLAEFPLEVVAQAHALLSTGNLFSSEKCLGVATWLRDLHVARRAAVRTDRRDNLTWRAVAGAPAGYCHVRSGMIGTLLEDITAGLGFADIKARFDAKMHPLQYLRPQAAPSAGNIAQAEAVVAKLASAGALARRFAQVDELQALWRPAPVAEPARASGVFGHLLAPRAPTPITQPAITMTWTKFVRTILPTAAQLEFMVPAGKLSYAALVTAADPAASPILQWDLEDQRNPFSWYLYAEGSLPAAWNLTAGRHQPVTAIALQPSMWSGDGKFAHHGLAAFLILDGARDVNYERGGGFFPSLLKSEYHGVRATLEAHAQGAVIAGAQAASACGLRLQQRATETWAHALRVTASGAVQTYVIDRWD